MSNDKTPQSKLAMDLALNAHDSTKSTRASAAKVFAGLPNERVKLSADDVFGRPAQGKAPLPSSVQVHILRRRTFQKKPGQEPG